MPRRNLQRAVADTAATPGCPGAIGQLWPVGRSASLKPASPYDMPDDDLASPVEIRCGIGESHRERILGRNASRPPKTPGWSASAKHSDQH